MVRTPLVSLSVTALFGVAVAGIGARQPAPHARSASQAIDRLTVADIKPNVLLDDERFGRP